MSDQKLDEKRRDPLSGERVPEAKPAATLVIFRDRENGQPPDLLMVERSTKMAFAGGAAVFPGGRVDDADFDFARSLNAADVDEDAARLAAIRESIEETGIPVALDGDLEAAKVAEARSALHDGTIFSEICAQFDWKPQLDKLIPFARWRPPFAEARVFDTRFYLVAHEDHMAEATVDATENYNLFWSSARGVIDRAQAGKVKVIFPTMRNLERLALFGRFAEAVEHTSQFPVELVEPFMEERDGVPHLCIRDDAGYPVTAEAMESVLRGSEKSK